MRSCFILRSRHPHSCGAQFQHKKIRMIRASLEEKERRRPTAAFKTIVGGGTAVAATVMLKLFGGFDRFKNCGEEKGAHAVYEVVTKARFASVIESKADEATTQTTSFTAEPKSSISSMETFRLRQHWQPGFMWQELLEEDWYCAACAICDPNELFGGRKNCLPQDCKENMTLAIMKCEPSRPLDDRIARFTRLKNGSPLPFNVASDGFDGDQIQVHNTNLCLQMMPAGQVFVPIKLQQCNSTVRRQHFFGKRSAGQAMELNLFSGNAIKCVSNHHHPNNNEQIYAENCELARYGSHYVTFKFCLAEGGRISLFVFVFLDNYLQHCLSSSSILFRAATNHLWCPFSGDSETVGTCVPSVVTKKPATRRPSTVKPTESPPSKAPSMPAITARPKSAKPTTAKPAITARPTLVRKPSRKPSWKPSRKPSRKTSRKPSRKP